MAEDGTLLIEEAAFLGSSSDFTKTDSDRPRRMVFRMAGSRHSDNDGDADFNGSVDLSYEVTDCLDTKGTWSTACLILLR